MVYSIVYFNDEHTVEGYEWIGLRGHTTTRYSYPSNKTADG